MPLTGLHLLLTYQCTLECDHCFVWSSPEARGTMSLADVREILRQAEDLGGIEWIFFEGGEPFLFYPLLRAGVRLAARKGFRVGIVSNAYWATGVREAREALRPFHGLVQDLSLSSDNYHGDAEDGRLAENAATAARDLGIPCGMIRVAQPEEADAAPSVGQLPPGVSAVMYRGRAAKQLVRRARLHPWTELDRCPHENLRDPERVHIDPEGNVHLCQGISLGNVFERSLREIVRAYDPEAHPIAGPLVSGGPAGLVRRYRVAHRRRYADACHLCDETRRALRRRFPEILRPNRMYGLP
ncbi:MAG TPA: radical SAM protein [Thermoplasmata archaeon]|nr:radical SAM protein [Thermoplasmata archaeon]